MSVLHTRNASSGIGTALRLLFAVATGGAFVAAHAQSTVAAPEARDMAQIGFHDLQARSAYQPLVREQNGRWILYVGHHGGTEGVPRPLNPLTGVREFNGTSIVDVTDPRAPRYLAHIPGDEGLGESGGAQMVRVCSGKELPHGDPGKDYLLRTFGNSAVDIRDPYHPREIASVSDRTEPRCIKVDGADRCKVAIQTNNVEVDDRGFVYAVDRANTGLVILELAGEARRVANFPP